MIHDSLQGDSSFIDSVFLIWAVSQLRASCRPLSRKLQQLSTWRARHASQATCAACHCKAMGADQQVMRVFKHWRSVAVNIFVQHRSITVHVRWGEESTVRKLIRRQALETRVEDPEDEILPEDRFGQKQRSGSNLRDRFVAVNGLCSLASCFLRFVTLCLLFFFLADRPSSWIRYLLADYVAKAMSHVM